MLVTDVMTRRPVSITTDWRVKQAALLAADQEVSALPVLDRRGHICGIVNDADLIHNASLRSPMLLVSDLMTSPAITVSGSTDLVDAVELMISRSIRSLPVVDDDGCVVGMISRTDVVRGSVLEVGRGHVELAVPCGDSACEVLPDRRHQPEISA